MGSPESILLVDQKPAAARILGRPYLISVCDAEKPAGIAGETAVHKFLSDSRTSGETNWLFRMRLDKGTISRIVADLSKAPKISRPAESEDPICGIDDKVCPTLYKNESFRGKRSSFH